MDTLQSTLSPGHGEDGRGLFVFIALLTNVWRPDGVYRPAHVTSPLGGPDYPEIVLSLLFRSRERNPFNDLVYVVPHLIPLFATLRSSAAPFHSS